MGSHDKILSNLEKIVKKGALNVKELEYGIPSRVIGEVDYLLLYNNSWRSFHNKKDGAT